MNTLEDNFILVPKEPYDDYLRGRAYTRKTDGRRYINFGQCTAKYPRMPPNTPYARYLYQTHLWEKNKELIPDYMHVDHINNDKTDDRIENYQLLTPLENLRKQGALLYAKIPLDKEKLVEISDLLYMGWSRQLIAQHVSYTIPYLRYLINEHLPQYAQDEGLDGEAENIRLLLESGRDIDYIAEDYGVSPASIKYIIKKHFPHLREVSLFDKKRQLVGEYLEKGLDYKEISRETGLPQSSTWVIIRRYYPDYIEQWRQKRETQRAHDLEIIEDCIKNTNLTHAEIGKKLDLSGSEVARLVVRYFPEYAKRFKIPKRVELAKTMYVAGATVEEIMKKTGLSRSIVNAAADPQYRVNISGFKNDFKNQEDLIRRCEEDLESGFLNSAIAIRLGVSRPTITKWIMQYFPQYSQLYRRARSICTDPLIKGYADVLQEAKRIVNETKDSDMLAKEKGILRKDILTFKRRMELDIEAP